jgi:hypothetical protein
MKPKPVFDPDWTAPSPRRFWPICSIWKLMLAVAACGLLFAVSVSMARQPLTSIVYWDPGLAPARAERAQLAFYPAPDMTPEGRAAISCPSEPPLPPVIPDQMNRTIAASAAESIDPKMVMIAPESIDSKMVIRAPAWIDPEMVFTPRGSTQQAEQGGVPGEGLPEIAPGVGPPYELVPAPDGSSLPPTMPKYMLVPGPDGSSPPAKAPRYKPVPIPNGSSHAATPRR